GGGGRGGGGGRVGWGAPPRGGGAGPGRAPPAGGGRGSPGGSANPPRRGRRPCRSRSPACARPRRPNGRGRTGSCYRRYRRQGSYASRLPPVITISYPTGCRVGKPELQFFPCCSCSIRPRQADDVVGEGR